jgi:hypothetical protein
MFPFVIIFVLCMLFAGLVVLAQRAEVPLSPDRESKPIDVPPAKQVPRANRFREGTAFKDKHVFFRHTNDRTVLYTTHDNQSFLCLENLHLERILTTIQEKPERQFWKIDGEFTEFRGENFVLIRRAVVAQAPVTTAPVTPPPATP